MLETMRRRIRSLVKLIDKTKRGIVYSDFEDEPGELSAASLRGMEVGTDLSRFEQKLRIYLRTHENQLAVQKLRRNRQITTTDLAELERIFIEAGIGTEDEIDCAKSNPGGLRFVNEVIDYLAHNGTITVDVLYTSPFNSIAPGGPEDIFTEIDINAMITTMHAVNATSVPA